MCVCLRHFFVTHSTNMIIFQVQGPGSSATGGTAGDSGRTMRASGTSLVVQWPRLHTPYAGSIPGRGTRSHTPQVRVHMPQLRPGPERQILSFEHLDAEGSGGRLVMCRQLMLESTHSIAWMYWKLSMHPFHVHLLSARDMHTLQT